MLQEWPEDFRSSRSLPRCQAGQAGTQQAILTPGTGDQPGLGWHSTKAQSPVRGGIISALSAGHCLRTRHRNVIKRTSRPRSAGSVPVHLDMTAQVYRTPPLVLWLPMPALRLAVLQDAEGSQTQYTPSPSPSVLTLRGPDGRRARSCTEGGGRLSQIAPIGQT